MFLASSARPAWLGRAGWAGDRSGTRELARAVALGGTRPSEARLTGFSYAPAPSQTRRLGEPDRSPDVLIAAAKLEKAALEQPAAASLAAVGAAYLVLGEMDKAVAALEDAVSRDGAQPGFQNDLSAAYLTRAARLNRADDYARALAAAERSIKAGPRAVEPWFNRALALGGLHLGSAQAAAWAEYVTHSGSDGWADEARRRAAAVDQRPVSSPPSFASVDGASAAAFVLPGEWREAARDWLENTALPAWGAEYLRRDADSAGRTLQRAAEVASALASARGDMMPLDGIERIRRALTRADASTAGRLARAHVTFGEARKQFLADRLTDAAGLFEQAARDFRSGDSPYARWAPVYRAIVHRTAGDSQAALRLLEDATPDRACARYRYLCGRARWMRGVIQVARGELVEALDEHRRALADLEAVGESEYAVGALSLLSEDYFYLGDQTESWNYQRLATARLHEVTNIARRHLVIMQGVYVASWSELPEVSLHYLNTLAAMEEAEHDVVGLSEVYLHRARVKGLLGDPGALADLDRAAVSLSSVADAGLRARDGAEIEAARADLLPDRSDESIAAASRALEYFRQAQFRYRSVMILRSRARAYAARGNIDRAEEDLSAGIEVFEEQRRQLSRPEARLTAFEDAWSTFRDMIRLQAVLKHRPDIALRYAERGRGRGLLESVAGSDVEGSGDAFDPARWLPDDTAVVYYASLPDRLLIWALTASGTVFKESPVAEATLTSQVRALRAALPRGAPTGQLPSLLYDELLAPVAAEIAKAFTLVIVPDVGLHDLPFAFLRRPGGRFVLEDHAVAFAPNLSLLHRAAGPRGDGTAPSTALVVQPSTGSDSSALPGAAREAREIAGMYPGARTLLGVEATKSQMGALAGSFDVIHFAGHARSNSRYPQLSHLVLAPDSRGDAEFMAYELSRLDLRRTQLAVLASCQTAAGRAAAGEGILSLARPFLASGVPWVIASLWDLDDRAGSELFPAFHRALRSGLAPHLALREAQLAFVQGNHGLAPGSTMWTPVVAIAGNGSLSSRDWTARDTR